MEHSAESIKQDIYTTIQDGSEDKSNPDWKKWHIGLTIYPNQEKKDRGKPTSWNSWKANSAMEAKEVESYFINNYPINGKKAGGKFDYFVFIYKS